MAFEKSNTPAAAETTKQISVAISPDLAERLGANLVSELTHITHDAIEGVTFGGISTGRAEAFFNVPIDANEEKTKAQIEALLSGNNSAEEGHE
ncbi:MAG: hypothetical protein WCJ84_00100 [Candidatus Peregrinibacteria bacterium]